MKLFARWFELLTAIRVALEAIQPGLDLALNCDLLSAPGAVIPTLVLFTREAPQ